MLQQAVGAICTFGERPVFVQAQVSRKQPVVKYFHRALLAARSRSHPGY